MTEECTLMQRVEDGIVDCRGDIEWTPQQPCPVPASNRTRLLRRDAEYPTGTDGWKVIPNGSITIEGITYTLLQRYCWEDLRAYQETPQ